MSFTAQSCGPKQRLRKLDRFRHIFVFRLTQRSNLRPSHVDDYRSASNVPAAFANRISGRTDAAKWEKGSKESSCDNGVFWRKLHDLMWYCLHKSLKNNIVHVGDMPLVGDLLVYAMRALESGEASVNYCLNVVQLTRLCSVEVALLGYEGRAADNVTSRHHWEVLMVVASLMQIISGRFNFRW